MVPKSWLLFREQKYYCDLLCESEHCIKSIVLPKCKAILVQTCWVMFKESKRLIRRSLWIGTLLTWRVFSSKCKTTKNPSFFETGIYQKHKPIPWLPMPELFTSPGYQQPWYWQWRINVYLSSIRNMCSYFLKHLGNFPGTSNQPSYVHLRCSTFPDVTSWYL